VWLSERKWVYVKRERSLSSPSVNLSGSSIRLLDEA
jgi:hypothetical protein